MTAPTLSLYTMLASSNGHFRVDSLCHRLTVGNGCVRVESERANEGKIEEKVEAWKETLD